MKKGIKRGIAIVMAAILCVGCAGAEESAHAFEAEKYEYRPAPYEALERKPRRGHTEEYYEEQSRYEEKNGVYTSKEEEKDEVRILISGDLLCQEGIFNDYQTKDGSFDFSPCFDYVRPLLKSADLSIGNLETVVSDSAPYRGEVVGIDSSFYCNAPFEYLDAIRTAGFDMVTTANNHIADAGASGIYETIQNCEKMNLIHTGASNGETDKYAIIDVCGFKIGITAFCDFYNSKEDNFNEKGKDELLNFYTWDKAFRIYEEMKDAGAEYMICFPHWGTEYTDDLQYDQRLIMEELIGIGYQFIGGSHPHVLQRASAKNGSEFIYSMGNLMSHISNVDKNPDARFTVLSELVLTRKNGKVVSEVRYIPCRIFTNLRDVPYTVVPYDTNLQLDEKVQNLVKGLPNYTTNRLEVTEQKLDLEFPIKEEYLKEFKKQLELMPQRLCELDPPKQMLSIMTNVGKGQRVVTRDSGMNKRVQYVKVYDSVRKIGDRAFYYKVNLGSVKLSANLQTIDTMAFANCPNLSGLMLPDSMYYIGDRAFANCTNLMSITIPSRVQYIGDNAFKNCKKLTIYCEEGSYAEQYAKKYGIKYKYMPL